MAIQKIVIPETLKVRSDGTLQFAVSYESDDPTVGSLSVGLYFDSTVLKLVELPDIYYGSLLLPNSLNDIDYLSRDDSVDFDQNPNTDKLFLAAWSDYRQEWPGTTNVDLYTIKFQIQNGVDLNNFSTVINFTGSGAAGFTLDLPTNVVISGVNQIPVFADQIFIIDENTANGTEVGVLSITDVDNDPLTITENSDAFDVELIDGEYKVVVADSSLLDYETIPRFNFTVTAEDPSGESDSGNVTVNLYDVNEIPPNTDPVVGNTKVTIEENAATGTFVTNVNVTDDKAIDTLNIQLIRGNTDVDGDGNSAFKVQFSNGVWQVVVNDQGDLDFEKKAKFDLTIKATDAEGLFDEGLVTVNLNNIADNNQPPEFEQTFGPFKINEKSPNGLAIGKVTAMDVDQNDSITYSIMGENNDLDGDGKGAFSINNIGLISVNDSDDLVYINQSSFNIIIEAKDKLNGVATTNVNINLNSPPPQPHFSGANNDILDSRNISNSNGSKTLLYAGSGNDSVIANTGDRLFGGNGNDTLDGSQGEGNNLLFGGENDDILIAGKGDLLIGCSGNDQFKIVNNSLGSKPSIILDFETNNDKIDLSELTVNNQKVTFGNLSFDDSTEGRIGLKVLGITEPIAVILNISKEELSNENLFKFN